MPSVSSVTVGADDRGDGGYALPEARSWFYAPAIDARADGAGTGRENAMERAFWGNGRGRCAVDTDLRKECAVSRIACVY